MQTRLHGESIISVFQLYTKKKKVANSKKKSQILNGIFGYCVLSWIETVTRLEERRGNEEMESNRNNTKLQR